MVFNDNQTGSEGSAQTGDASASEGNQGQGQKSDQTPSTVDYEKKYKGLQTVYNRLEAKEQKTQGALDTALAEVESLNLQLATAKTKIASLEADLGKKDQEVNAEKENSKKESKTAMRLRLLVDEFSDLAKFEKAGILPSAETEEELKTALTNFRGTISSIVGEDVMKKLRGSGLPSNTFNDGDKNGSDQMTSDQIYDRLMKIAGDKTKILEYKELQRRYDELLAAQNKK